MISPDILAVVVALSVVQSLFGVGVLLFGTPLLLLLGYPFLETLTILLPVSLSINVMQVIKHHDYIDRTFYRHVLFYSVPVIVGCLFLVTKASVNIGLMVGLFLLFVALKDASPVLSRLVESLVRFGKPYFVVMGAVHGLTNLGGSLLTAAVHAHGYGKDVARATTAASYATFALSQLATLLLSVREPGRPLLEHGCYVAAGVGLFIVTDRVIYEAIDRERYARLFAALLFASGLVLSAKSLLAELN